MQLSYWEQSVFYKPYDVIVTGAGLQGLWCALLLKKSRPALRVLLLERAPTPYGASTRNAGFLCFGSPTELLHDARTCGESSMLRIAEMRYKGMRTIQQLFTPEQVDYNPCGGYECLTNAKHNIPELLEQLQWLNKSLQPITGKAAVFSEAINQPGTAGLRGFDTLLFNPLEAALHSGKLVYCLQQQVRELGVDILTGITITAYRDHAQGIELETDQAIRLRCSQALFCINAFSGSLFPGIGIEPGRGQMVLTQPVDGLQLNGTFHFDEGYYYFRNLANRLLLGGARNSSFDTERTTEIALSDPIQTTLEQFLHTHFHTTEPVIIEQRWAGIMGFTRNKEPLVQEVIPGCRVISACNGMGVALSPVVAEEVVQKLLGEL